MHQTNNFFGQSGFYHFFGIVEDRNDPDKHGRLRVRCFGIHSENKMELPTEHLPWAQVILPLDSSPSAAPNAWEGDMVFGFFADGVAMQVPIILGSVSSKLSKADPQVGFSDPRSSGVVAKPGSEPSTYNDLEGPGVSPMNSGIGYESTHVFKNKMPVTSLKLPGGESGDEPENPYNAMYPYNHADETESGHLIEFDDTPGAERVHIMHRTGTFIEMHPDGSVVVKTIKNHNSYTLGADLSYVKGNVTNSVDGTTSHRSGLSYSLEVDEGNVNITTKAGDVIVNVTGNVNMTTSGTVNITAGGEAAITAPLIKLNG